MYIRSYRAIVDILDILEIYSGKHEVSWTEKMLKDMCKNALNIEMFNFFLFYRFTNVYVNTYNICAYVFSMFIRAHYSDNKHISVLISISLLHVIISYK